MTTGTFRPSLSVCWEASETAEPVLRALVERGNLTPALHFLAEGYLAEVLVRGLLHGRLTTLARVPRDVVVDGLADGVLVLGPNAAGPVALSLPPLASRPSDLPNAARWSEHLYWGSAPVGLLCFGLMGYVNIDIPADDEHEHHDDEHYDDEHYDEDDHE